MNVTNMSPWSRQVTRTGRFRKLKKSVRIYCDDEVMAFSSQLATLAS